MKRLRRGHKIVSGLLLLATVATGILTGCGNSENATVSPIVQVKSNGATGSGILYAQRENSLVIITAAHVLQTAADTVEVAFADDYVAESSSYTLSKTADVAFIDIPTEALSEEALQKYQPVTVDKKRFDILAEGEKMILRGFSTDDSLQELDATLIYPWIYAEDFNQYMMLIRGEVLPGMSGGGIFDSAGNFTGIICGVSEARETAAVPLSIVVSEYSLRYE